ncbi:MAG: hypothetical protein RMM08_10100 [Armatimonadota bacterium]|nr:hypothetical protein [bacterium]MDW8321705.1 hypothetical protein [Armatimonadota bacterium]
MKHLAASVILCLLCARGTFAQAEERVFWSLQKAEDSSVALYRFLGKSEPSAATDTLARWVLWEEGERLRCESSNGSLRAAALHLPRTWTLLLWNEAEQKVKVVIEGELPAGVYTVERLTLTGNGEIMAAERRNGLRQGGAGKTQRVEWLDARSGLVLRFVERLQAVNGTLNALRRSVWQSEVSRGVLSRLAALMREVDSHWYQAQANLRKGNVSMAARGVHRMLFLVSGMRVASSKYAGAEGVTGQTDALIDALSELSSALLNIVISVRCEGQSLHVQVVNAGAQVWKALRLTPESSADNDAVVLANLKPMERAEASFRLSEGFAPVIVASVLFNGGYARLRVPCGSAGADKKEAEP